MEIFYRRRFFLWLLRAYIKKWGKVFFTFFLLGIAFFLILRQFFPNLTPIYQTEQTKKIGIVGSSTIDSLPGGIQEKISLGLTRVNEKGEEEPLAAEKWEIDNDGKTYIFHLKKDLAFQDGEKFTSSQVNYQFKEAKISVIDPHMIRFDLNEPFAPFLSVASRPIFKKGLSGLGAYKVYAIERNGPFIKSVSIQNRSAPRERVIFRFYPTEQAVKTALILGEVDEIELFDASDFKDFSNLLVEAKVESSKQVAIFYNTRDPLLSKQVRQGLTYALPDSFNGQKEANSPLSFISWAYKDQTDKFNQNLDNARRLLGEKVTINLTTYPRFYSLAQQIQEAWKQAGVETNIQVVETRPADFQATLDMINIPKDPDQYNFWHSQSPMNLTGYSSQRIDKLLEDGRKTIDKEKRREIYDDFQKYLVDDAPASFLFYPTVYTVKRK